jgi:site-specific DNA recombinase
MDESRYIASKTDVLPLLFVPTRRLMRPKGIKCPEPYTREERLTQEITTVLGELVVPKAVTDWLRAAWRDSDITETRAREQAIQHAQQECDRLNQRIETMYLDKLDGRISASFYDEKAAAWLRDEAKHRRRIVELRAASQNFESAIRAIEETNSVCKTFRTQPATEQRRLLTLLVDSATWKGGELETTLRTPFQKLRLSNRTSRSKEAGNGPGVAEMKNWLPGMDSNHN